MRSLLALLAVALLAGCLDAEPTPASDITLEGDVANTLPENFTKSEVVVATAMGAAVAQDFIVNETVLFKGHGVWETPVWTLELQNVTGDVVATASGVSEGSFEMDLEPGNYTLVARASTPVAYDAVEIHGMFSLPVANE